MKKSILFLIISLFIACSNIENDDDIEFENSVSFTGTVLDCDTGMPIANATVELHRYISYTEILSPDSYDGLKETTTTDSNGKYSISVEKGSSPVDGHYKYKTETSAKNYWTNQYIQSPPGNNQNHLLKPLAWINLKIINQSNNMTIKSGHISYAEGSNEFTQEGIQCRKNGVSFNGEIGIAEQNFLIKAIGNSTAYIYWQSDIGDPFLLFKDTLYLHTQDTTYSEIIF